ncbi:RHS repeat-associated core domain-containing protein (plasmid) [Streptomyces sp. CA-100214]
MTPTTGYLTFAPARYDTVTGRFTRPDPYTARPGTPFTQPYAYVENMPTSRIDPSGMCSVTTQLKTCSRATSASTQTAPRKTARLPLCPRGSVGQGTLPTRSPTKPLRLQDRRASASSMA